MAIFSANRCLQVSLQLQSNRLFISSWAKKRYTSSGPVRYVPGTFNQAKKVQKNPKLDDSAEKDPILMRNGRLNEQKNVDRIPFFHPNEFGNSLFDANSTENSCIYEPVQGSPKLSDNISPNLGFRDTDSPDEPELLFEEENPNDDFEALPEGNQNADDNIIMMRSEVDRMKTRQDVENLAIELLAGRAFTAFELRKKLRGKRYPLAIIDSVISDIKSRGLLNDGLYAESFSRSRWHTSSWGPKRIEQALVKKGVSEAEVQKATKQVFEEEDPSDGSRYVVHGMSKPLLDRLFIQASKQWFRGQDASPEKRNARVIRWLQYRGFNWGITSFILKKLQSQHST